MKNNSIRPGQVFYDTEGKRIQAHGAQLWYENGTFYWIGENKDHTTKEGNIWTWGVRLYSSEDFYNWRDEGLIIEPDEQNENSVFYPVRRLDRPHLLFNERTKKYVLWLKFCDEAHYSVLTADALKGPYTLIKSVYRPYGVKCGDYDLAKDEKTGRAYLYFEVDHTDVWAAELSEDYTETKGEYSVIFHGLQPPFAREGISHCEREGKHYLFSSGMTGYVPNPSEVAVSDDWLTGFTVLGNPHRNDESSASFNSQISSVFKYPGKDLYIAIADRWVPEFRMTAQKYDVLVRAVRSHFDPTIAVTAEEKRSLMDMPLMGTADTSIADYVWLPISFENGMAFIDWKQEWRTEEY